MCRSDPVQLNQIERLWKMDLILEKPGIGVGTSKKDRLTLISINKSKRLVGGHYQLVLPWKPGSPSFDDNRTVAEARLNNLKKRLDKNLELRFFGQKPDLHGSKALTF